MEPFVYDLPPEKIAQRPVHPADSAKLLYLNRSEQFVGDYLFTDLLSLVTDRDLLVFNDTKVLPARLFGKKSDTGANIELLLLKPESTDIWRCMGRPLKRIKVKDIINFSFGYTAEVVEKFEDQILVKFNGENGIEGLLDSQGNMPIPPYIRDGNSDKQDIVDYQTIFAKNTGSIAAPTASLHFTEDLFNKLKTKGLNSIFLTLHVGAASILPLYRDNHLRKPPAEEVFISDETKDIIRSHKKNGGKIVAVGTTVVRALESWGFKEDTLKKNTDLFITPGFNFNVVDSLITNFHQPGTTHLLLVEALLGRSLLERSYLHALNNSYRFLSYGDGMFIR